jgi:hypothetical protein
VGTITDVLDPWEYSRAAVQYATTSIGSVSTLYRAPEPVLTEMEKAQRVAKKGVKQCMCCGKSKFGLFAGK